MSQSFETLAIHVGQAPEPMTWAVLPPIFATTTYQHVPWPSESSKSLRWRRTDCQ